MSEPTQEKLINLALFPIGARVKLISTTDPYTDLEPGAVGTVQHVDDLGTIHVAWDNAGLLGMVLGEDFICLI